MSRNTFGSAAGLGQYGEYKNVTFAGGAGTGAIGEVDLFTVTGSVLLNMVCVCSGSLTGQAGATIEVGISGSTAAIIAQTLAANLINTEIWHDNSPDSKIEAGGVMASYIISGGEDVILTVGTGNVSSGSLAIQAWWTPITVDGAVAAA